MARYHADDFHVVAGDFLNLDFIVYRWTWPPNGPVVEDAIKVDREAFTMVVVRRLLLSRSLAQMTYNYSWGVSRS